MNVSQVTSRVQTPFNGAWRPVVLFAFWLLPSLALAQSQVPDAGSISQQIERERQQIQPANKASPLLVLPKPAPAKAGEGTLIVKQFKFEGNTTLSEASLQAFLAQYLNHPVTAAQLQDATNAVADFYASNGWLVSTTLPKQEIAEGTVTIQITEALFGKLQFQGSAARVSQAQIQGILHHHVAPGQRLSLVAMERALMLADELPGVNVVGRLMAGQENRDTDVLLSLSDEPLTNGEAALDNHGGRATGSQRGHLSLNLNSPLGLADLVNIYGQQSEGTKFLRLSETLPIGYSGLKAGLNASHLGYTILGQPSDIAGAGSTGTSRAIAAELSYPLLRTKTSQMNLELNHERKNFDNRNVTGSVTTEYTTRVTQLSLNGNVTDGDTMQTGNVSVSAGDVNLDGSPNQAQDASTTQTQGRFAKARFNYTLTHNLSAMRSLYLSLQGQAASKNLDSSEGFFLGGATGVRAYPSNEGSGSQGVLFNFEWRQRLSEAFQLIGFYDYGRVQVAKFPSTTSVATANDLSLRGAGLGLNWSGPHRIEVKTVWAHRVGHNPNPSSTGMDQDGTLTLNRFWLAASVTF